MNRDSARRVIQDFFDTVVAMDAQGNIADWNRQAEETFGWEKPEVIGRKACEVLISPRSHPAFEAGFLQLKAMPYSQMLGGPIELTGLNKGGAEFPVELALASLQVQNMFFYHGFFRSLPKREGREIRFQAIVESVPMGIVVVDELGRVALSNSEVERMFGYERGELLGREIDELVPLRFRPQHSGFRQGFSHSPQKRQMGVGRDLTGLRKDGTEFPVEVGLNPMATAGGNLVLAAILDITERKRAEEQLRQTDLALHAAVKTRDDFLSIASHELKTPLTTLQLQLQLGLRNLKQVPDPPEYLDRFAKACEVSLRQVYLLANLVEEMLDISQLQSGRFTLKLGEVKLANVIRAVVAQFSELLRKAKCPVRLDLEEGIVGCWDHFRIEQILTNLISNITKYAPGCPAKISSRRKGDMILLVIEDNGPGIPVEKQSKLFERFERGVSPKGVSGLGLGLYVVKKIVEAHHGSVRLESAPGEGARFIIELPVKVIQFGEGKSAAEA